MIKFIKKWLAWRRIRKARNLFDAIIYEGGAVNVPSGPPRCPVCGKIVGEPVYRGNDYLCTQLTAACEDVGCPEKWASH